MSGKKQNGKRTKRFDDLTGRVFSDWLVLSFHCLGDLGESYWKCKCVCGKEKIVNGCSLRRGLSKSCGCVGRARSGSSKKPSLKKIGQPWRAVWFRYRTSAKNKQLIFSLSEEQFKHLISSDCFYCGSVPSSYITERKVGLYYSGIDRKNNTEGYTLENSVACCWPCNQMKKAMDIFTFINHVKRIAKNHAKNFQFN